MSFVGDIGPFAGLATGLGIVWLVRLLYFDSVVSPLGAGLILSPPPRVFYML